MSNVYISSTFFLPLNSNFEQFPVLKALSALKSTLCVAAGKTVKGWGRWEWGGGLSAFAIVSPLTQRAAALVLNTGCSLVSG